MEIRNNETKAKDFDQEAPSAARGRCDFGRPQFYQPPQESWGYLS